MAKDNYIVSVYMCDRAYGGPEEGGWYYDCGEPVEELCIFMRTFTDEDQAYAYRNRLQRAIDVVFNCGRPSISSVLSRGRYRVIVDRNEMPAAYPKYRPCYE